MPSSSKLAILLEEKSSKLHSGVSIHGNDGDGRMVNELHVVPCLLAQSTLLQMTNNGARGRLDEVLENAILLMRPHGCGMNAMSKGASC